MKQRAVLGILLAFGLLMPTGSTAAQEEEELRLTVRRTFGYRGGDQIQGRFALGIEGPEDLVRVAFFIDGKVMAEDREAPFEHSFHTREYGLGIHRLSAIGHTAGGAELRSVDRTFEFVTAEAGWETAGRIVAPLAVAILGMLVVGTVIPAVLGRKHPFRLGDYGAAGGAVCPRCRLPYSRTFWSPNLVGPRRALRPFGSAQGARAQGGELGRTARSTRGKLERCPHCGKRSVVRRAPEVELREAESRYLLDSQPQVEAGQDSQRRLIDESRFES